MSETLIITNLGGPLTRRNTGDINSGLTKFETSWGYDPYSKPGSLTWLPQPTSIQTLTGSPVGPIVAMKERVSGSAVEVYAVSEGDRLYFVDVNSATNPDLDVVDTAAASPSIIGMTYDFGGRLTFYGSTEKIFISSDTQIQVVNFSGASPSIIGTFATAYPRPMTQFLGRIYFGNANNLGEIDSTEVITTVAKLSPALPSGLVIRDLDVTPDGNYLQMTVSRAYTSYPSGTAAEVAAAAAADSYKFYWNGIDGSYSVQENYPGLVLSANEVQPDQNYSFGYSVDGAGIWQGSKKIASLPRAITPAPTATFSVGNILGFATTEQDTTDSRFRAAVYTYGKYDEETVNGLFRLLRQDTTTSGNEILVVPACVSVSNKVYTPSIRSATNQTVGSGKIYFSTYEDNAGATSIISKLWRFHLTPQGTQSVLAGVYETQTQLFSKKTTIKEVRLYTEPLVGGNDFTIDLIGSGRSVMAGGSQRFRVATGSVATGTDMVQFNPAMAPTYALGLRITNASVTGVANWTGLKAEIDFAEGGR